MNTVSAVAIRGMYLHTSCMAQEDLIALESGARLKRCRKGMGWTQEELALATGWTSKKPSTGLSPSRIANFEQGTRRIRHEEARALERVFDIPAAYFMALLDQRETDIVSTLRGLKGRAHHLEPTT